MSDDNPLPFDQERREMFAIRSAIGHQIGYHRGRYGNKDGRAPDGAYRRYENPLFQQIEEHLNAASNAIFEAEKLIFSLPRPRPTTEEERSFPEDAVHENGNYHCRCVVCEQTFIGYKRRVVCKVCKELVKAPDPCNIAAEVG